MEFKLIILEIVYEDVKLLQTVWNGDGWQASVMRWMLWVS
jgi:hypothetical protein